MQGFAPTNYLNNDTIKMTRLYDINRYRTPESERGGFLKNEKADTSLKALYQITRKHAGSRGSRNRLFTRDNNAQAAGPISTRKRGVAAYLRNNELLRGNAIAAQRGAATYSRTFTGMLAQKQNPQNETGIQNAADTIARRSGITGRFPASSGRNRVIQQYANLNSPVTNTNDLIRRGIDVYRKNRRLSPLSLQSLQNNPAKKNSPSLAIPPTRNFLRSHGLTQYLILNSDTAKNTNTADLYLKAGPKRMLESQLFI